MSGTTSSTPTINGQPAADVLRRLAEPLAPADIEWRMQSSGEKNGKVWARVLAYVTSRAIMDTLDRVVGPDRWRNEKPEAGPAGGVLAGISIRLDDGTWVTKWDGAENTDVEAVKGGLSGAMKRAGVQWGIGRYLYNLEEGFARVHDGGAHYAKTKEGKAFKWDPPDLPAWALPPKGERQATAPEPAPSPREQRQSEERQEGEERKARKTERAPIAEMTTAQAMAMPFPFNKGKKIHGTPLGDIKSDHLTSVATWIAETQSENGEDWHADTLHAIRLILADREKDQTKLALVPAGAAEGEDDDGLPF